MRFDLLVLIDRLTGRLIPPLTTHKHKRTRARRSVLLCVVVEKAKKCLDFGATLFIFHLLFCWGYEVSPKNVHTLLIRNVCPRH